MEIPIIIAFDDKFAIGAGVLMQSVLENTAARVRFVLLHGEVTRINRDRIQEVADRSGQARVEWIDIRDAVDRLPLPFKKNYYNQMAYARLLSAELLTDSRVIYLDADTLVQGDVRELYDWDLEGMPLAAIPDLAAYQRARVDAGFKDYLQGLMKDRPLLDYFNSGVLVLDLEECREQALLSKVIQTIHTTEKLRYADQCALNIVLRGEYAKLPTRWNTLVIYRDMVDDPSVEPWLQREVADALANPGLLHYVGAKPWTPFPTPCKQRYLGVMGRTPWRDAGVKLSDLTWRQTGKLIGAWRRRTLRVRLGRDELKLFVLGKRVIDWSPSRRAA